MSDETETVSTAPTPQSRNPKIIAVASGKGGVGKTWCAIGLSHGLALSGKRVLLFDGDLGLANVDIQLGLMPEHDLGHVMLGEMSLKQSRIPYLDGGFDIIAGRSGSVSLSTLPASRLAWLREQINLLSEDYDYIVLDLGAGIERTVRSLASQAEICVVVVTPDPTSLTDSYAYIKTIHSKPPYPDTRILVNLADTKLEGDKTYKTLQKACYNFLKLNPTLLGIVRRDKKVIDGIRAQQPILNFSPKSDAALDIKSAAALLA